MSLIVSEIYDALIEAGTSKDKAKAAAAAVPSVERLATKEDIARLEGATKGGHCQAGRGHQGGTLPSWKGLEGAHQDRGGQDIAKLERSTKEDIAKLERSHQGGHCQARQESGRTESRGFQSPTGILALLVKLVFFP